jgi:hypothetical protein
VRLGAVVAHRLSDLVFGELSDHARADDERDHQRGHRREHGAQGDIAEDVERTHVGCDPVG